jgi:hypothetical protein
MACWLLALANWQYKTFPYIIRMMALFCSKLGRYFFSLSVLSAAFSAAIFNFILLILAAD